MRRSSFHPIPTRSHADVVNIETKFKCSTCQGVVYGYGSQERLRGLRIWHAKCSICDTMVYCRITIRFTKVRAKKKPGHYTQASSITS